MYQAIIARVTVKPHPNADRIQLADVCGTTVVVGKDVQTGDLGVYFPTDGVLSHEFVVGNNLYNASARKALELGDGPTGFFDVHRRVRAQSFRGAKSDGLWLPLSSLLAFAHPDELSEGLLFTHLRDQMICEKWVTAKTASTASAKRAVKKGELVGFPKHMDTEQWFHYVDTIPDNSLLIVTEKLHGTSHRVGNVKDPDRAWWQFWKPRYTIVHGSRNVVLSGEGERNSFYGTDEFRIKATENLIPHIRKGEVWFGEIIGDAGPSSPIMPPQTISEKDFPVERAKFNQVATWYYGVPRGLAEFVVYRIVQFNEDGEGIELSHAQVVRRAKHAGVRVVPHLFTSLNTPASVGEYLKDLTGDPATQSIFTPETQMREGIVIRVESPDGHTKFYKNKSFLFKVLEGIIKLDESNVDREESA